MQIKRRLFTTTKNDKNECECTIRKPTENCLDSKNRIFQITGIVNYALCIPIYYLLVFIKYSNKTG